MYSPSNLLSDQGQKSRLTPLVAPQVQSMMCREVQCRNVAMGYIFGKLFWVCLRFQLTNSKFSTVEKKILASQYYYNKDNNKKNKKDNTKDNHKVDHKDNFRTSPSIAHILCLLYLSECFKIKKKKKKKKVFKRF